MPQTEFDVYDLAVQIARLMPEGFTAKKNAHGNREDTEIHRSDGSHLWLRYDSHKHRVRISACSPFTKMSPSDSPDAITVSANHRPGYIWNDIQRRLWTQAVDYWDTKAENQRQHNIWVERKTGLAYEIAHVADGVVQNEKDPYQLTVKGPGWNVDYISVNSDTEELGKVKIRMQFDIPYPEALQLLIAYRLSKIPPEQRPVPKPQERNHASLPN